MRNDLKIHYKKDKMASTFNSRTSEVDISRCGEYIYKDVSTTLQDSCPGVVNQHKTDSVCAFVNVYILCVLCVYVILHCLSHSICVCFHIGKVLFLLLIVFREEKEH